MQASIPLLTAFPAAFQAKNTMTRFIILSLLTTGLLFSGCKKNDDDEGPGAPCGLNITDNTVFYEFQHVGSGETFVAWTDDPDLIDEVEAQLALPESQRNKHIHGNIERVPEDCDLFINDIWSWYFPADGWTLAEVSIEICDGDPNYVEANLDEFVDNVGSYCPWGSYVLQEIPQPF